MASRDDRFRKTGGSINATSGPPTGGRPSAGAGQRAPGTTDAGPSGGTQPGPGTPTTGTQPTTGTPSTGTRPATSTDTTSQQTTTSQQQPTSQQTTPSGTTTSQHTTTSQQTTGGQQPTGTGQSSARGTTGEGGGRQQTTSGTSAENPVTGALLDPAQDFNVDATYPILLLPVRLETRFVSRDDHPELWVRIYPDEIFADTHEPELTADEIAAGQKYWADCWCPARKDGSKGPPTEDDLEAAERDCWRFLISRYRPSRSAWIVLATAPTNLDADRTASAPQFPASPQRTSSWTRAAQASLLPDRFMILAYRDGQEVKRAWTSLVKQPLALTMTPTRDGIETVDVSGDGPDKGLHLDEAVAWTVDFSRALDKGMACKIALDDVPDLDKGFDLVLAVGIRHTLSPTKAAAQLGDLLHAHHYTRGLSFVPQGTPAHNTQDVVSGHPPRDPNGAASFEVERKDPLNAEKDSDGARFAGALGLDPAVMAHVAGADGNEFLSSQAMNNALWPATLGYFMMQMMDPVFSVDDVRAFRDYYTRYILGRGPFAAFRVGGVPYGLLPVTSLQQFTAGPEGLVLPTEAALSDGIRQLLKAWQSEAVEAAVPHIDTPAAETEDNLQQMLGMDASARQIVLESGTGPLVQTNLLALAGEDVKAWVTKQKGTIKQVAEMLGHPDWELFVALMEYSDQANFTGALVEATATSETNPLATNYIDEIVNADYRDLRNKPALPKTPYGTLLYALLRHATLAELKRLGLEFLHDINLAPPSAHKERELAGMNAAGQERATIWDQLGAVVPRATGGAPLGDFLMSPQSPKKDDIDSYYASLKVLSPLPTAELERLLTETLDACSHRIDAWITSLATKRLADMRKKKDRAQGCHVAAFAWVEGLKPREVRPREAKLHDGRRAVEASYYNQGYIQAPSATHAATAAVLRNAYFSKEANEEGRYALNLSSARVRMGRWLLDSVRNGQQLGAVLGYQVERELHDLQLDYCIYPLRTKFPLVANKGQDSGEPAEAVAARNVVDGLRLRNAWRTDALDYDALDIKDKDARTNIDGVLSRLDGAIDAVADLLVADGVYHLVRGNTMGAAASLDATAQGLRPPDPDIARMPRTAASLTNRFALVLGGQALKADAWQAATPRGFGTPWLNGWIGSLLGDPSQVRFRVSVPDPQENDPKHRREVTKTMADLNLQPMDVLALAKVVTESAADSELDRRAAFAVLGDTPTDDIQVIYAASPDWVNPARTVRTVPEILEVARAITSVLGGARGLTPTDLVLPESASAAAAATYDTNAMRDCVTSPRQSLIDAQVALSSALKAAGIDTSKDDVTGELDVISKLKPPFVGKEITSIRDAIRLAAGFGISGAFPPPATSLPKDADDLGAIKKVTDFLGTAVAVMAEVNRRVATVLKVEAYEAKVNGPSGADVAKFVTQKLEAMFGKDYVYAPVFKPAQTDALAAALKAGPDLAAPGDLERWFRQAARVRAPLARWRRLRLYTEALGVARQQMALAQLPYAAKEQWVGAPIDQAREFPTAGRVSVVLDQAASPAAGDNWVGLLLDEWAETMPVRDQSTSVAFHFESARSEPSQSILLAVPPTDAPTWDLDTVVAILTETLHLAKTRLVDMDCLAKAEGVNQVLPAVFLAFNARGDTVTTDLRPLREVVAEPEPIVS